MNVYKEERLEALHETLGEVLSSADEANARLLLWEFITVFTLKKRHDNTGGKWKRAWYKLLAYSMLPIGYIRDVHVNSTVGVELFGAYAKFGTLTATLKRVKEAEFISNRGFYYSEHGPISSKRYELACQICEVLNDYDPEHC